MLKVGLTGSIAVGKSFVATELMKLGCYVLDADQTAREVVAAGSAGLRAVVDAFGEEVLSKDQTLDRARLGAIVFADEAQRLRLNSILHPFIMESQDEQLRRWEAADPDGIGVIDAALMIESGGYRRFDEIIVVHCRPEVQLQRLMTRNSLTCEEATRRIASQMPQQEKMRYADYLIDTSAGFESVRQETARVYGALRGEAEKGRGEKGLLGR